MNVGDEYSPESSIVEGISSIYRGVSVTLRSCLGRSDGRTVVGSGGTVLHHTS